MQYIDNDMDELFEKAGRDYPLKTDNSNWDAVFGKLQQPDAGTTAPNPRPANKKYYWLLLLLVLPIGYIISDSTLITGKNSRPRTDNHISALKNSEAGNSINNNSSHNGFNNKQYKNVQKTNIPVKSSINIVEQEPGNRVNGLHRGGGRLSLPYFSINYSYEKPFINIPVAANSYQPAAQPKLKTVSKLYAGLIVGPDISTVKYQQINNIGYSVGILAGYNISGKLAIEAGILYSKKRYYTDGKYFDKTKANISPNVYIKNLDGGCEMFEIPISLRYNFRTGPNSLFATAGLTSYFMKDEDYNYKAYAGGSYYDGYRSYKNSGNHFFSNAQLSVGYNYQLSQKISLRAEPYIKIPVNKIGIGRMPVTSAGIYFGVIKNIK